MKKIVTAAEMREVDRLTTELYATPSLLLMEAAAGAAARVIASHFSHDLSGRRVQILCGRGNNGGDGAALARALLTAGARVDLVLFGRAEDSRGDARTNFDIVRGLAGAGGTASPSSLAFTQCEGAAEWESLAGSHGSYEVVVDALFGTGLTRPLEGAHARVVEHIDALRSARMGGARPLIVSLDLPSGLDADRAQPIGPAVRADITVTFTAPKPANVLPPASRFNGRLYTADIGSPRALLDASPSKFFLTEAEDARAWLEATRYAPGSYKNSHGHALVVAGSRDMTGAAVLCASAAMRAGAGLVTLAAPASILPAVAARLPAEVMTAPLSETPAGGVAFEALGEVERLSERATVVAVGCGLTREHESTRRFVRELIARRTKPVIVDADGLNALAPWPSELRGTADAPVILTPHEGEMLRLMGARDRSALEDRARAVSEFAAGHRLVVALKGERTLIAAPDGRVLVNATGNRGLGTAGSGDTLTGVIAGFNAQAFATLKGQADAVAATAAAVYVGGLAADIAAAEVGVRALSASDVRERMAAALLALDPEGETP